MLGGMNHRHRFSGVEFDWFASDLEGAIALFATAGSGFIPDAVLTGGEHHEAIASGIDTPNWGSLAVWDAYSKLGFYVFDWKSGAHSYLRVRVPDGTLPSELRKRVEGLPNLPEYPGRFREADEISHEWRATH